MSAVQAADEPVGEPRGRGLLRKLIGPLAAAGTFLGKYGVLLLKLKAINAFGSMILSVSASALLGGWWFGLGLVGLLFVHEPGQVLELRRQGCRPRPRYLSRSSVPSSG